MTHITKTTRNIKYLDTIRFVHPKKTFFQRKALEAEVEKAYTHWQRKGYSLLLRDRDGMTEFMIMSQSIESFRQFQFDGRDPTYYANIRGMYLGKDKVKRRPFFKIKNPYSFVKTEIKFFKDYEMKKKVRSNEAW